MQTPDLQVSLRGVQRCGKFAFIIKGGVVGIPHDGLIRLDLALDPHRPDASAALMAMKQRMASLMLNC